MGNDRMVAQALCASEQRSGVVTARAALQAVENDPQRGLPFGLRGGKVIEIDEILVGCLPGLAG